MTTVADAAVLVTSGAGLSILLKATLVLALGLVAARLARRQRASLRHLVLAVTFATLVALPLVLLIGPEVSIQVPSATPRITRSTSVVPAAGTIAAAASPARQASGLDRRIERPSLMTIVAGAWGLGAVAMIASIIFDLWRVRRVVRQGLPSVDLQRRVTMLAYDAGLRRHVDVVTHEEVLAPFAYGVRPAIVLPADATGWSDSDLDRALVHELEHVRRSDWLVQLVARFATAGYWCHPLAWVAWRRLCLEAERACDDAVVQRAERTDYAEQLVTMAQRLSRTTAQPVPGMANRSDLARRVSALLDGTQRRGRVGMAPAAAAIGAAALICAAIAPVRAVGVPPVSGTPAEAPSNTAQDTRAARGPRRTPASALNNALYEAASEGDDEAIAQLLGAGAEVNAAMSGDGTPLIGAARKGHLSTVRLLLERGANLDLAVSGDGNPLIMAAAEGHLAVVTLLLDRGASVDLAVPGDENALIQASGNGHLEVVKLLVSRGANVNARIWADGNRADGEWRTPLGMARKGRHSAVVEFLQSAGAVQ